MLRVLICDDEKKICLLIKEFINWEKLGLTLIGVTYSGLEALQQIKEYHPDIVITDIRMPVIDGLELIKRTRELKLNTAFIIISGYQTFDYARSAMHYGISDYLLKPINKVELNSALERIKNSILEQRDTKTIQIELDYAKKRIQENLIKGIISCASMKQYTIIEPEFRSIIGENQYLFIIIKFDSNIRDTGQALNVKVVMDKAISYIKEKTFAKDVSFNFLKQVNSLFCIVHAKILPNDTLAQISNDLFQASFRYSSTFSDVFVTLGIGPRSSGFQELPDAVQSVFEAIQSRVLLGVNRVIKPQLPYQPASFHFGSSQIIAFDNLIDSCNIVNLSNYLVDIINSQVLPERPYLIFEIADTILNEFVQFLKHSASVSINTDRIYKHFYSKIEYIWSVPILVETLEECFNIYFNAVAESKQFKTTPSIQMAKSYIAEHYSEECSLNMVAEHVHLNASYFSYVFKAETGITFSQYVTNYKLTIAKQLLKETNDTVQAVASKVGYRDIKNFRKLFKKMIGVNPNTYRSLYQ